MFAVVSVLERSINVVLWIVSPLLRVFVSVQRTLALLEFLPFFLTYFSMEGPISMKRHTVISRGEVVRPISWAVSARDLARSHPFVAVICLQYLPVVFLDLRVFLTYVGFLVEFLWLVVPVFAVTTTCSYLFYRCTGSVWSGALFNALVASWVVSTVFPF